MSATSIVARSMWLGYGLGMWIDFFRGPSLRLMAAEDESKGDSIWARQRGVTWV